MNESVFHGLMWLAIAFGAIAVVLWCVDYFGGLAPESDGDRLNDDHDDPLDVSECNAATAIAAAAHEVPTEVSYVESATSGFRPVGRSLPPEHAGPSAGSGQGRGDRAEVGLDHAATGSDGQGEGGRASPQPGQQAPRARISQGKGDEVKPVKPYMPEPGGAVPFQTRTKTPMKARTNAANKLPRKAKHTKPRGM